ncbi:MAG: hypothetical protein QNK37_18730 [Acidobacteriota bacterium]|nr:hypothetical protein [Acidobacteriota bacterium]
MKKTLKLESLRVKSFVTIKEAEKVRAGRALALETENTILCCE